MQVPWHKIVEANVRGLVVCVRRIVGNDHDAEDVVQEVFAEAYRVSSTMTIENWSAMLHRIAQRRAIDHLRRQARRVSVTEIDLPDQIATTQADPSESLDATELDDQLRLALAQLSDREACVFSLAYFERMSRPEIAIELETTINAVNIAIHKAVQKLRGHLENQTHESEATHES